MYPSGRRPCALIGGRREGPVWPTVANGDVSRRSQVPPMITI